jgi:hypothetical protein
MVRYQNWIKNVFLTLHGHNIHRQRRQLSKFLMRYSVYVPPLPTSIHEFRDRITHALQAITADMLHRAWDEFDYRVDVCRVTQGAHIEGL